MNIGKLMHLVFLCMSCSYVYSVRPVAIVIPNRWIKTCSFEKLLNYLTLLKKSKLAVRLENREYNQLFLRIYKDISTKQKKNKSCDDKALLEQKDVEILEKKIIVPSTEQETINNVSKEIIKKKKCFVCVRVRSKK